MRTRTNRNLFEKFVDRTVGERTVGNRLMTVETDSGNVALIGHKWLKLAEYDESRGVVTVFTGHKSIGSETTNRHLNRVVTIAQDRGRDVVLSGESPVYDTPTEATKYIGNYVGSGKNSPVEKQAKREVDEALAD